MIKEQQSEDYVTGDVIEIFEQNRSAYGTRKIKVELHKHGFIVSKRRIGRIMKEQGFFFLYSGTVQSTNPYNESVQAHELKREFQ